jgi:hypothetical protein
MHVALWGTRSKRTGDMLRQDDHSCCEAPRAVCCANALLQVLFFWPRIVAGGQGCAVNNSCCVLCTCPAAGFPCPGRTATRSRPYAHICGMHCAVSFQKYKHRLIPRDCAHAVLQVFLFLAAHCGWRPRQCSFQSIAQPQLKYVTQTVLCILNMPCCRFSFAWPRIVASGQSSAVNNPCCVLCKCAAAGFLFPGRALWLAARAGQ